MLKDVNGVELKIGDTVLYKKKLGNSHKIFKSEIVEMNKKIKLLSGTTNLSRVIKIEKDMDDKNLDFLIRSINNLL